MTNTAETSVRPHQEENKQEAYVLNVLENIESKCSPHCNNLQPARTIQSDSTTPDNCNHSSDCISTVPDNQIPLNRHGDNTVHLVYTDRVAYQEVEVRWL